MADILCSCCQKRPLRVVQPEEQEAVGNYLWRWGMTGGETEGVLICDCGNAVLLMDEDEARRRRALRRVLKRVKGE